MNKRLSYLLMATAIGGVALCSCHSTKQEAKEGYAVKYSERPVGALPKAVVYKTNGNYADHVFVNLDAAGTGLLYFPATTDILQSDSKPVALQDGYLLARQGGIGTNSRFLTWTYEEYAKLPSTPNPAEIMAHIIPEARVTEVEVLPITLNEALKDLPAVEKLLAK